MPHIPIRNSEDENDTVIYFPVPSDRILTLDDLRSAFPSITSLRYMDLDDNKQHHVLCRDNAFIEPEGGWTKDGRLFLAVGSTMANGNSRYGIFESYRRRIGTKSNLPPTNTSEVSTSRKSTDTTMISVGHGHFKSGRFSRISGNSLSLSGGLVVVGPFSKNEKTAEKIKIAAFQKFSQQHRPFRQKYSNSEQFHLLYPDGSLVDMLPDKSDHFTLLGYRNFVDPTKRFERLRLYLCEKSNYEDHNQSIEIISESSSEEEMPELFSGTSVRSAAGSMAQHSQESVAFRSGDCANDVQIIEDADTLPLVIDVVFHHGENSFVETFPNNTRASVLLTYIENSGQTSGNNVVLKYRDCQEIINLDDRLMELTNTSPFHVYVDVTSKRHDEHDEQVVSNAGISAEFENKSGDEVAGNLVTATLQSMDGITEPKCILKKYQQNFLQGRDLDLTRLDDTIEGETTSIFIGRQTLLNDAIAEIKYARNIRFPIEACFYGESAQDLGGPRREFFSSFIREFRDKYIDVEDSETITLRKADEAIAKHRYFYAGLIIGLSVIQGGPAAEYVDGVVLSRDGEEKQQFLDGLKRTGVLQLLNKTPTMQYIFKPDTRDLTVNILVHLFEVEFSEEGSNRRTEEETAYGQYVRYLREVYAGRRGNVTLRRILKFSTGSSQEPILGFSMQPTIGFSETIFPTASTCINRLILPLAMEYQKLDLAFVNDFFGME